MGLSNPTASLPFLAIGLGICLSIPTRFWDLQILRRRHRSHTPIEPEDKIIGFAFAAPALMIGLWWFSWTIPPLISGLNFIIPTVGLVLVGFAVNEIAYTLSGYLEDTYTVYAASAFAGLAFVRALISGIMPLVGYVMFGTLKANVVGSILAGVATVFCLAPVVFFRYGRRLRERSEFASFSLEVNQRTQIESL